MKKTVVMIMGGNAVGKSTLAKEIQRFYGGVKYTCREYTLLNNEKVAFVGGYKNRFGGVDVLNNIKEVASIEKDLFEKHIDLIFCEGMYLSSFGVATLSALFAGEKAYLIFLYAPLSVIKKRIEERSRSKDCKYIFKQQEKYFATVKKMQSIGVPLLAFDTSKMNTTTMVEKIVYFLNDGGYKNTI